MKVGRRRGRRTAALSVLLAPALFLAACGGSTVESADVTTSSSSTSETTSTTDTTTTSSESADEPQAHDSAATRATSLPDNRTPLSEEDEDFLSAMENSDVDIDGTEDQVMAAARSECVDGEDPEYSEILIGAVAGQLIAQERTELSESEVAQQIADAAESAYC